MPDEVRRRRWAPVVTWVEEGDARLMKSRREEKWASSFDRGRRREFDCVGQRSRSGGSGTDLGAKRRDGKR